MRRGVPRLKCSLAFLVVLVLAPMLGEAEVRLQAGAAGPELVVQPVQQGVWTPRGLPDSYTVNPDGDILGDGFPAHASTNGLLVAAWQRPSQHAVVVLRAMSPAASALIEVPTLDGVGKPTVTSLDSGFLVTWQSSSTDPLVKAVVASDGGVSTPIPIVSGRLLDVYRIGDSVHVVAFDAVERSLNIGTIPTGYIPTPIPIPVGHVPVQLGSIPTLWVPLPVPVRTLHRPDRLGTTPTLWEPLPIPVRTFHEPVRIGTMPATHVPSPIPVPVGRRPAQPGTTPALWEPNPIPIPIERVPLLRTFGAAPLETTPPPEFVTSPDTWQPCVEERGGDVLLAWQAGRSVLGRVILDATGVEGAGEFYWSPNGSCEAILNAAERH